MSKITIERETLERAVDAMQDYARHTGWTDATIGHLRAALAAQPAPAAVPLTDEQIMRMEYPHSKMVDFGIYAVTDDDCIKFARAIERAHGIAAGDKP